ncbi:hypothetical protein OG2516_05388 [Oceanicola granulosus HTCC2516]|uniref:Uncharacterized protein n=1 Tax=Oceanicola granulosus (strain ATCC BAA-861 / DSM 15982 / KCTC 12143 / HTCC2516) TaxID=314256 RepID=Q2CIS4_OCEGH|nr:hypothetical protein [Oceanicola granulosus]EAR52515.1 hypothetical protein OG2516_05388 [Oceanicola granulosus HTCC2516]
MHAAARRAAHELGRLEDDLAAFEERLLDGTASSADLQALDRMMQALADLRVFLEAIAAAKDGAAALAGVALADVRARLAGEEAGGIGRKGVEIFGR